MTAKRRTQGSAMVWAGADFGKEAAQARPVVMTPWRPPRPRARTRSSPLSRLRRPTDRHRASLQAAATVDSKRWARMGRELAVAHRLGRNAGGGVNRWSVASKVRPRRGPHRSAHSQLTSPFHRRSTRTRGCSRNLGRTLRAARAARLADTKAHSEKQGPMVLPERALLRAP
jgi:hypothetical protein